MKIISRREVIETVNHYRAFGRANEYGYSFSFSCDANGNVAPKFQTRVNEYINDPNLIDMGIEERASCYTRPALGLCDCGQEIQLDSFTNTCDCGRDYNWAGQLLAHRSQWGEETGESPADILRIR